MLRSSRSEFVVEGYQVGVWMKRTAERLVREKKEQEEKKREKERRRREENERKDKEIRRKQLEAKKRRQDRFEKNFEEFSKELKNIQREYLREKKRVAEEEKQQSEINVEKRKEGEREERVAEEVILETSSYPNLVPRCDSVVQEVEDEIPKEQCSESIEVKLQETNEDSKHASPRKVPYNFLSDMRMRHQVDIIPSAPLLTRPAFSVHEEVPPKEIEDKKIFFNDENKGEASEQNVRMESVLIKEIKVERASLARKLKYIFLSKDACFTTNADFLHGGTGFLLKAHILIIPRKVPNGFKRITFDPGG